MADQLEQESLEIKQNQLLSHPRGVILNQNTDAMKARLIDWACHGPSGVDIPQDIPLTRPQTRELNERIRREMAYRNLPMITPIPLPPPISGNIPPLRPPKGKDTYRPITGTYDKPPRRHDPAAPPERSDWTPPTQPPPRPLRPQSQAPITTSTRNYPPIPYDEDRPLFKRHITHSSELPPPPYPNTNTTSSTVYVYNATPPPKGQAWKVGFTKAFDRPSTANPDPLLRLTLQSVTYAPHYPNMLCLRVAHTPGLENADRLHGIREVVRKGFFGEGNVKLKLARTFTDIIVTFEESGPPAPQATTAATQVTKLLDLRRANHPAKYI